MTTGQWVARVQGIPTVSNFATTGGRGTPIIVDEITGQAYFLSSDNVVTAMGTGGAAAQFWVTPEQFGAVGDNITDDGPAFLDALDYLQDGRVGTNGSIALRPGQKKYFLGTTTLPIRTTLIFEGVSRYGTTLRWAQNTIGIINQRSNTVGLTGTAGVTMGAGDQSIFRNMTLQGAYSSDVATPEGAYHGIALRARAHLDNLLIASFQGDGIYCSVEAGGGVEGNANCSYITNCTAQTCRTGMLIDGADANTWSTVLFDGNSNRTWGLWDSSFLGNSHVGLHTAANGWDGAISSIPTACVYAGRRYACIPGQEIWCSTNPPTGTGTSNQGWQHLGAGGTYSGVVNWVSGTIFRAGGGFYIDGGGGNQQNVLTNPYSEGDQNPGRCAGGTLVLAGANPSGIYQGTTPDPYPGWVKGDGLYVRTNGDLQAGRDLDVVRNQTIAGYSIVQGAISARGGGAFGPNNSVTVGTASFSLNFTNGDFFDMPFYSWSAGVNTERGYIRVFTSGVVYSAQALLQYKIGGALIASIDSTGLNLESGKVLKVNGTQVITSRQVKPATPTLTDVINVLVTHGLWA